jgi:hypothetical protein
VHSRIARAGPASRVLFHPALRSDFTSIRLSKDYKPQAIEQARHTNQKPGLIGAGLVFGLPEIQAATDLLVRPSVVMG